MHHDVPEHSGVAVAAVLAGAPISNERETTGILRNPIKTIL